MSRDLRFGNGAITPIATHRGLSESVLSANPTYQTLHDSFQSSRGEPPWPSGFVQFILCAVPSALLRESSVHSRTTHKILSIIGNAPGGAWLVAWASYFQITEILLFTLLSAKFSWSNSLRSWFRVSRDKICATFNMPRSAPETLNNGEQSLDFTYYEQTTNRFWSPHLAESRVFIGLRIKTI